MTIIALVVLIAVVLTLLYALLYVHDIPYRIAKERGHPHQDAIQVAGWISLLTLHAMWPFLWIWARMYRRRDGFGFGNEALLLERVEVLERELASLRREKAEAASRLDPELRIG